MQVIVNARHTAVPDGMKEMAVAKIERVRRFFDRINSLHIEFSEEHNPRIANKFHVEVTLTTKAHLVRASANGPDPQSAVDAVVDKLEAQVKRLKGKRIRRGGRNGADNGLATRARDASVNALEFADEIEGGDPATPRITRTARIEVKPMTPEEAILQMEALGEEFHLFMDAETKQASVVYRRSDGTYGLIEST